MFCHPTLGEQPFISVCLANLTIDQGLKAVPDLISPSD